MDSTISHTYNILLFFHVFSSETALTWFAMDFTDDPSGQLEKLAVRLKGFKKFYYLHLLKKKKYESVLKIAILKI